MLLIAPGSGISPVLNREREDGISVAQRLDAARVIAHRYFACLQPAFQRAYLINIKIVYKLSDKLRRGRAGRRDAVSRQLFEHFFSIYVGHPRCI